MPTHNLFMWSWNIESTFQSFADFALETNSFSIKSLKSMTYNIEFLKPMTSVRNGSCMSMSSIEAIIQKDFEIIMFV